MSIENNDSTRFRPWEAALVAAAIAAALSLGFANLGAPSLWHDEAVQVLVARSIAETGRALLPSGQPHPVAPVFNAIVAAFIRFFGDSEASVRAPSVLFAAVNVLLTYLVARPLLGRATAMLSAFALALSPWSVAWSREARFYTAQQTFYLIVVWACWRVFTAPRRTGRRPVQPEAATQSDIQSCTFEMDRPAACPTGALYSLLALCAYALGVGTSLHSVLFLGPIGAYAFCMLIATRQLRGRWTVACMVSGAAVMLTVLLYYLALPSHDAAVVFGSADPLKTMGDPAQRSRLYYLSWLWNNLGAGFVLMALLGSALMLQRERGRGLYAALAFWGPFLALSLLIGYRRHRFLLFAFPFYTMAFSHGIVATAQYVIETGRWEGRRPWLRLAVSAMILIFGCRLAVSAGRLTWDSIDAACGANTTLATRHPQYRQPCHYVREHLTPDTAVLSDTYVTALYYVGRVDNWFPSGRIKWEAWEIGNKGLETLADLQSFMAEHPKGYFVAEWYRFNLFHEQKAEREWVQTHMKRVEEASSGDVTLYAWGM